MDLFFKQPANLSCLVELLDSGVSVIPVDDSKEPFSPFKGKNSLGIVELIDKCSQLHRDGRGEVKRFAIRTGFVSGGLVCIDVDSKHNEGFSERIYLDFKELFPEIWNRVRIEKTPSGGLHFYYQVAIRVGDDWEISSCNLAHRKSNADELVLKPKEDKKCFLELKASDGSLCTAYPSIGYIELKKAEGLFYFGTLTLEEHKKIIEFCYLYEEVPKEEFGIKKFKGASKGIYIDGFTPFDEFNNSSEGSEVLKDLGWRAYKTRGLYDQYIKPGKKDNEIGATFQREKRTYAIFTTNSGIETRCYNPSSLLCQEKFGGDWEKLYIHLVGIGYGKIKPELEKIEVKKALRNGIEELPANFSESGKEQFKLGKENKNQVNPFGEFWVETIGLGEDVKYSISREAIMRVSKELGFRMYKEKPVLIVGNLVKFVEDRIYFDVMKEYIGQPNNQELLDVYEDFLQKSGKFTISRLELLDVGLIVTSSKYVSYKFFQNCYVKVEVDGVEILSYEDLEENRLIWEHDKKTRDFNLVEVEEMRKGLYFEFVKNAIGWSEYLMKCIGFYAHDYRDEEGYMMITTEKSDNEKDGGRCGKNIFWKLFSLTTTFKSTAASMIKKDNQLLQSWTGERIFCLSDMPKNFDLIFFKDMITDGAVIRKLYKDEFVVSVHDMAKIGGSSNYTFDDSDPGVKGRLRLVEFTKYYKEKGGVKEATGKMFPKDWSDEDYLMFDNVMITCIQEYLIGNCVIEERKISDTGWNRKFEGMYYHLYNFIKDNIDDWVKSGRVKNTDFNSTYSSFRFESNINKALTSFTINKALTDYCEHFGIALVVNYRKKNGEMSDGITWTESSKTIRGRYFGKVADDFLNGRIEVGEEIGVGIGVGIGKEVKVPF